MTEEHALWKPRVLVLGHGGAKGYLLLGFLSALYDTDIFKYTDTFCGVSVGAAISLLLVCGYKPREIINESIFLNIFVDMQSLSVEQILRKKGIVDTTSIAARLSDLVLRKLGVIPTMANLYALTGLSLATVRYNTTDETSEIVTPFNHGDTSCIDATVDSMSIPLLMMLRSRDGKSYVDGALANPYPVNFFDDSQTSILGVYIKSNDYEEIHQEGESPIEDFIKTVFPLFSKVVRSAMDQRRVEIINNSSDMCKHIGLPCIIHDSTGLTLSLENKASMILSGHEKGIEFIEDLKNNTFITRIPSYHGKYTYPPYYLQE